MPKIPGVSQRAAIAALQKAGFQIIRQSGHVVMSNGVRTLTIPRHSLQKRRFHPRRIPKTAVINVP